MIRKFTAVSAVGVTVCVLTLLAGTAIEAQQTSSQPAPVQQAPTAKPSDQQSSSQEASQEETTRIAKPKLYKNWTFNVGGGASLTNGTTQKFVRGGGGIGAAGVARNFSQYFGFRADFQYDNLPLKQSALLSAQAPGASSEAYTLMIDPIINIPASKDWGGYIVFGGDYIHRSGKLDSSTALPGSGCNPFFTWWGNCFDRSLPLNGKFLITSQNEFGYNFGFGLTHRITERIELYGEFRYLHGSKNGITTDLRPITIGVRF
jgi:opacity protein-like surface antigen